MGTTDETDETDFSLSDEIQVCLPVNEKLHFRRSWCGKALFFQRLQVGQQVFEVLCGDHALERGH